MYEAAEPPFQIDANLGFGGAVLSMLSVDLPLAHDSDETAVRTVVLGPAIPSAWAGGSVNGLRIRGGGIVHFKWNDSGLVTTAQLTDSKSRVKVVNKAGTILAEHK
jgi:alpha-L-fucosidase 2